MSHDGAAFSQHSVLSPPLLAAIDSQHTFGSHHAVSVSPSHDHSVNPGTRSRASSSTSLQNVASSQVHQTRHVTGNKKPRRAQQAHSAHSRNGSRSGASSVPGRSAASNSICSATVTLDDQTRLNASLRNRSTSHLDDIGSQSAAREHNASSRETTAMTAPPSPLTSASAPLAFAMSPIAQASAMADHLMPTDWNLDSPAPASPPLAPSRNASDYFDSALLAQLQSQNNSSHPELRANDGRPDPSPPLDTVFGRLSPRHTHAARSASQSEWAQHAAHVQQTAHLLGLQRLFASRSTPHLPDLDSSYLGHEFESPPPYAPQASAHETELERAADLGAGAQGLRANQNGLPSNSSSSSTLHNGSDPPLPPPISIPFSSGSQSLSSPPSATVLARPPLRARSSSRGSRSGPPSPSASFYGRRGLTSLSPFPAGLEMTPSVAHVSSFSSNPASPQFAPDSDGDEDLATMLSFSSTRSKQRRDERRQTIASTDNLARLDSSSSNAFSSSLPGSSAQTHAVLSRRRRSGSAGSARQLLRPRTPINSTQVRASASAADPLRDEGSQTASRPFTAPSGSGTSYVAADADTEGQQRRLTDRPASRASRSDDQHADTSSPPISPTSDTSRPESPMSPDPAYDPSPTIFSIDRSSAMHEVGGSSVPKSSATAAEEDEETFPLVLKLLLHSLRVLAAVPGCIGTFWLARNAWILATEHGHLLSPGHIVISNNGTKHFWSANSPQLQPALLDAHRLGRRQPGSLDFAVACLWSMSTAYHALSFTTLLLRRWLLYYSILPSLIRLVALQAICWPLVRITVHVFGVDQPLGAWVVIGTTTALSDVVSRWVTSNIADAPLDGELDEEEEDDEADDVLGYLSDSRFVKSPPRQSAADRVLPADQHPWSAAGGQSLVGDSDWDPRSGDESDAAAASFFASERERQRRRRRGGQGTRFWRAVIGGPSFAATSRRRKNDDGAGMGTSAGGRSRQSGGTGTETEMEADSDWPGYTTDRTVLGGSGTPPSRSGPRWDQHGLRRRLPPHVNPAATASPSPVDRAATERGMFGRRPVLPPFPFKASMYRQGHTRYVYRDGAWVRERTSSRRNFHWEVAVWRNVVPIAVLSYLSMWILIFDAMRLGG